ncbi:MAG: hydantoinase/oxoprolinase family protein [Anaerolineaceae bacterium]|nr:MAG: hydantoinase/oxoprolinase family protein [Anaerolineaceae bacterium]
MLRLGVDTGGTFTDYVWLDAHGRLRLHKRLSTPHDPSQSVLSGIDALKVPQNAEVVHGSTVATNALLERRGARTALITTKGFADVLAIGRQNRPDLYALVPTKPAPLVPRQWRFEVDERVSAQGEILVPLRAESLQPVLKQMAVDEIESIAVCLLFSFLVPQHERLILQEIQKWFETVGAEGRSASADVHVSLSSEILPEYREYERTATTVINAYVAPLMNRYLSRLASGLQRRRLTVMQSNGGIINAETAGRIAARTVLSGPAGGVVGARYVAGKAGYEALITFDMGGTSTDVALCPGRLPSTARGEIAGLPLRLPIIDIHTVGAGGGSLAFVDAGGALHVGPQSAGADPGPACYGKRVAERQQVEQGRDLFFGATTTDANLILGRLDAANFLGGEKYLDLRAAKSALAKLARAMGSGSITETAWGVVQVANANMERAIRRISVERGFDPRRFTLVAFGGAGPLHACELARNLQIPRVLVPTIPGVLSALGMLAAAPTNDFSQTVMRQVDETGATLVQWLLENFRPLVERALIEMADEGHDPASIVLQRSLDMRYVGQSHELIVPFQENDVGSAFHAAHARRYGYQRAHAQVEIVTLRLSAVAPVTPPSLYKETRETADARAAAVGEKPVWFGDEQTVATLYERGKLRPGHLFSGPAVVFQYDTTTVISPGWLSEVDDYGNLILSNLS